MSKVIKNQSGGKKPLCIIGTASSAVDAPFDMEIDGEPLYEIWAINGAMTNPDIKRIDKVFEMHPKRYWGQQVVTDRLSDFDGECVMQDHYDQIPNSVKYPYDEVKEMFYLDAMGDNLYVTNTITWMILMALYEGYTDINLYGVHMSHETEYAYQRASCSWALGIIHGWIMEGKDYKLTIAPESQLLKAEYEYGFAEPTKAMQYIKGRMDGMKLGISEADTQIKSLNERKLRTEGAMSEAKHMFEKLAGWK